MKFGTWWYEWARVQGLNGYRLGPVGTSPWSMPENKKSLSFSLQTQPEDIVPPEEREAKAQINFLDSHVNYSAENHEKEASLCFLQVFLVSNTTLRLCDVSS